MCYESLLMCEWWNCKKILLAVWMYISVYLSLLLCFFFYYFFFCLKNYLFYYFLISNSDSIIYNWFLLCLLIIYLLTSEVWTCSTYIRAFNFFIFCLEHLRNSLSVYFGIIKQNKEIVNFSLKVIIKCSNWKNLLLF